MDQLFPNGTYYGEGRWMDQNAEGAYTAQYEIASVEGAKVHTVKRVFLKPDGGVAYEENTTVTFLPAQRNAVTVHIHGTQGSVSGQGYAFEQSCHYEMDVAADNHLEFTFHAGNGNIDGMGSATNKGNFTSWRESLKRAG